MKYYFYTNALGTYIFDESLKIVKTKKFKPSYENLKTLSLGEYLNEENSLLDEFKNKEVISLCSKKSYKIARKANFDDKNISKVYGKVMTMFTTKEHFALLRDLNIDFSGEMLKRIEPLDFLVIQSINGIDELDKIINMLSTRLREWFSLYNPELSKKISNNEHFAKEVLKLEKKENSIGMKISKTDLEPMKSLANSVLNMYSLKLSQENYLETLMTSNYPNLSAVATPLIGARLISYSGSMKRLINFPSSTIQTLGAEKAMFRHLKSSSKPPKYGIIILHPYVNDAKKLDRGKIARTLASKIIIAAKIDYFGGDSHIGYQIKEDLEKSIK